MINYLKMRYLIWFLIIFAYLIITAVIFEFLSFFRKSSSKENVDRPWFDKFSSDYDIASFQGERVVHLDLKGAPPSVDYLKHVFSLLYALGVTSVLIEYEDIFPYSSKYTRAINSYSKEDIRILLNTAKNNRIRVIPLIQSFGHLEFILKMKKFSHLREEFKYPQSICPSHNDTFSIITGLMDEIIDLHPHIRYIHIGCDEVYQLGLCEKCTEKMSSQHWSKDELFLDHVTRIAKFIRTKYPHVVPLMWDDQLRSITIDKLVSFNIGTLIEPVIWFYRPVVSLPHDLWVKYSKIFPSVWIASSFKGATGPDKILTNTSYHVQNQMSWMQKISKYSYLINFKGIIITGWQRYDHFAVLCELLPVSIPSLVHVALVLNGPHSDRDKMSQKIKNVIACGMHDDFSDLCTFPGVDIYQAVVRFLRLKTEIDDVFSSSPVRGWLTDYNVKTKYFNTLLNEELSLKMKDSLSSIKHVENLLHEALSAVYDKYTVIEWLETNVKPYESKLNHVSRILRNLADLTEWDLRYSEANSNI